MHPWVIEGNCIVEVKCPWSARTKTIRQAAESRDFYLYLDEVTDTLTLKPTHNYWHQIQGNLNLTGTSSCHLPTLITPYPNPAPGPQTTLNRPHSRTRVKIENTFGILKSRFQCLRGLRVCPERACDIIVACAVLHNIATLRKEMPPPFDPFLEGEHILQMDARAGQRMREHICQNHFN